MSRGRTLTTPQTRYSAARQPTTGTLTAPNQIDAEIDSGTEADRSEGTRGERSLRVVFCAGTRAGKVVGEGNTNRHMAVDCFRGATWVR